MVLRVAADGIGDAIVLEALFTSFLDIVAAQYPLENLGDLVTQHWDSRSHARDIRQPLLVIHGDIDKIVPTVLGREIFATAGSRKKQFLEIAGAGHQTI